MARLERIAERLELKEFQLRALLDVTKAINNNMEEVELVELYRSIVQEQLGITRLMLHVNSDGWRTVLTYGTSEQMAPSDIEQAAVWYKDIQVIGSGDPGSLGAFDVAVPVHHRDKPLAFLLIGDIDEEEQRMSPTVKHLNFIQTLTNLIVVAMENRRMAREDLMRERDKRELELAAEMQAMLIPDRLPNEGTLRAAGWYQPHRQVGGDYYDLFKTTQDKVVFCVADVSGKGIAASLLMSNFQATLRALAQHGEEPLQAMIQGLNQRVYSNARGERFITLFLGRFDPRTRELEYVNSGHNDPLLLLNGKITGLHDGSIALGMMRDLPFLRPGKVEGIHDATVLCYTDGLVEQENGSGEAFEPEHLSELLLQHAKAGPSHLIETIRTDFEEHRQGSPYLDDIAVLACSFG